MEGIIGTNERRQVGEDIVYKEEAKGKRPKVRPRIRWHENW